MRFPPQGAGVKIEKESKLVPLAVIIVALAGLLISIVAARASFPVYLYHVVVILLFVAIFALLIYGFSASPIYDFIKKKRETKKYNALATKYFDEFKDFTEQFGELLDQIKRDNILDTLKDLWDKEAFRSVSFLSTEDFYNLFNCYKERLKRFDRTKEDFSLLVNEFDSTLDVYNKHCICKPVKGIRAIGIAKVNGDIKEDYKKKKGGYEIFLRNYTNFVKKLNKEFGERIFREDFEMPGEL